VAINVEIISDVSDVVKDTKTLSDRYDDVSDALKDLAKAGDKAGDKIEDAFDDGIRAAKKLDDKADAAFDSISRNAKQAGDDVGRSQKEGFQEAGEGLDNFKEEANSTAKESAASFDGSAESILGSFQEIAANAFAGFGPAGAAAGLAMAAGIGIAVTAMQKTAEEATEAKQKSVDMIDSIKEAGGDLAKMDLSEKIIAWGREVMEDNWITLWANEASTKFQETAKDAKEFGVTSRDAIRAAAGSADDSRKFLDETADDWQRLTKEIEAGASVTEDGVMAFTDASRAAQKKRDALSDLRGQAEENIRTTEDAVEIYELEKDALDHTKEAAEAAAEAIQEKADASSEAANAAMDLVGAENNWIETLKQMNEDIKTNGKNLESNTAAGRANKESLVDIAAAANQYRDAAIAAGEGTDSVTAKVQASRDAFINAAIAAGASEEHARLLADSYGLIPGNVETLIKANGTEEAKAAIESIPPAKDTKVTTTEEGSAEAQENIDAVEGKAVEVEVATPSGDLERVQAGIEGIHGKTVDISLRVTNLGQIQSTLDSLTAPRSMWITVNERPGVTAP
jgi:ABC-type transporter Mla subunit MlaD